MAQPKRRIAPKKKRTAVKKSQKAARRQDANVRSAAYEGRDGRADGQGSPTAEPGPTASLKERKAAEKRAFEVFDQQIAPLWDDFSPTECTQFAEGFNREMGTASCASRVIPPA